MPLDGRLPRFWAADGSAQVRMGGVVDDGVVGGPWDQMADPVAYTMFGRIELLTPDGDVPFVASFGDGVRITAGE
jgi:hypothetical protein